MESLLSDIRYSVRGLARTPGFTITVSLTLAFAFGLNTAVFSAVDTIVLRPLPYPDADRLVELTHVRPESAERNVAPARIEDWQRLNSTFETITGFSTADVSDTTGDVAQRTRVATVAPRFLETWGIGPVVGRGFIDAEHRVGGPRAALISDRYWRTRLGAAPDVLSRVVHLGEGPAAVVGVLPATFLFPDPAVDVWTPQPIDGPLSQFREALWYRGIGRLRVGVTIEQALGDLQRVQMQLGEQYPDTDRGLRPQVVPLKDVMVGGVRTSLWLLFGAVTVLLAIACSNVSALLLARAVRREAEFALRHTLGARAPAIVRQVFVETAVLVVIGAALGLVVLAAAAEMLRHAAPDWPRVDGVGIGLRTLLYIVPGVLSVALACSILPALRAVQAPLETGRTLGSTRHRLQWGLVGMQVTLAVVLLAGAGVLLRSSAALSRVEPGFDVDHVLAFRLSGEWAETANRPQFSQRIDRTLGTLAGLPGVEAVGTSSFLPAVPNDYAAELSFVDGVGAIADVDTIAVQQRLVSPSYFTTMKIPLVAGERCHAPTDGGLPTELMINQSFAARYFSGRSPLGNEVRTAGSLLRIVGVVGDARELGVDRLPVPTVYPCHQAGSPFSWFVVRTRSDPALVASTVRAGLAELEPGRAVYELSPLAEHVGNAYVSNRLRTRLLTIFGVAALALACLGLYATLSYVVGLRRREVGLRVALGAPKRRIVIAFVAQALRVVSIAAIAGVLLSLGTSRGLRGMLYGVQPSDPLTLAVVVVLVVGIAVLAALLPSIKAARVSPVHALREG